MAYLLFVDSSGQDRRESPFEVLAGIALRDADVWPLVRDLGELEEHHFGLRWLERPSDWKARELLKRKTFRLARGSAPLTVAERRELARSCLEHGAAASPEALAALAQAKIAFVEDALRALSRSRGRVFATMVPRDAPRSTLAGFRKDYAYLFERFSYFLEDQGAEERGMVVFDGMDRSRGDQLIDEMRRCFGETRKGQRRAERIIPEPLFANGELTAVLQLVDVAAYIVNWGLRFGPMDQETREELEPFSQAVRDLRYRARREVDGNRDFGVWSITVVSDLRTREEREQIRDR